MTPTMESQSNCTHELPVKALVPRSSGMGPSHVRILAAARPRHHARPGQRDLGFLDAGNRAIISSATATANAVAEFRQRSWRRSPPGACPDGGAADRQRQTLEPAPFAALARQPARKRSALGLRADHAGIGEVGSRQRLAGDQEIEGMVMRQDDDG